MIPLTFTNITVINSKFIVLEADKGICFEKLKAVTKKVDKVLVKWNFEGYFEEPVYHVTLFKLNLQKNEETNPQKN